MQTKTTTHAINRNIAFLPIKLPMDPICSSSESSKIKLLKINTSMCVGKIGQLVLACVVFTYGDL